MAEDASCELDDETIVLRMMDGDNDALRQLLRAHAPKTRAYIRRKFGEVLADPEIDEAMNVAAFNAFRFADRFDRHKGTLSTWFTTIAIRAAQGIIRNETKHRHRDLDYDPEYNPAGCDEIPAPADKAESRQIADLREAIRTLLTPAEREIIMTDLAGGEGDADDQRLAEITGRSKNTIHALRSKARKKIQEQMIKKGHYQGTQRGTP
jgi:RNA polymerase sigma factor (sigma-70 family)